MNHKQISFWLSTSDSQFWLNADRYYSYVGLNKQLTKLEQQNKEAAFEANDPEEEEDYDFVEETPEKLKRDIAADILNIKGQMEELKNLPEEDEQY